MNSTVEIQRVRINRNNWKTSLTKEIIHLEDNLDQIYYTVGLKPHRIVTEDANDEGALTTSDKGLNHIELRDFEGIINEQVDEIKQAVRNICALISSVTEFDLPIPVLVLLRIAGRIGSIRCSDFLKKVPGSLARRYVYTKVSPELAKSSLFMYRWISIILGTNILPFQPSINQNLINILEWTRISNLQKHDEPQYYSIRSQVLENISETLEQLSLNLNLDSVQLKALLELELVGTLEESLTKVPKVATAMTSISVSRDIHQRDEDDQHEHTTSSLLESLKDKYISDALVCLDRLFVVYADYLEAKLEAKLKNFIIQTSIRIYRDFEHSSNVIGLASRRQLLRLLESIANRPYATSTSELAWHIFELAERMESDPEIRYLCRRAVKFGLAHRPIVVSHFDVYDCHASALVQGGHSADGNAAPSISADHAATTSASTVTRDAETNLVEKASEKGEDKKGEKEKDKDKEKERDQEAAREKEPERVEKEAEVDAAMKAVENESEAESMAIEAQVQASNGDVTDQGSAAFAAAAPAVSLTIASTASASASAASVALSDQEIPFDDNNGLDEQVQSYLDLFVDKPATTLPAQSQPVNTGGQP